jgi:hypothetical protein
MDTVTRFHENITDAPRAGMLVIFRNCKNMANII